MWESHTEYEFLGRCQHVQWEGDLVLVTLPLKPPQEVWCIGHSSRPCRARLNRSKEDSTTMETCLYQRGWKGLTKSCKCCKRLGDWKRQKSAADSVKARPGAAALADGSALNYWYHECWSALILCVFQAQSLDVKLKHTYFKRRKAPILQPHYTKISEILITTVRPSPVTALT